MVTDEQVRLLRQKRMEGKTQEAAATAAGMGVRTARKWESGPLPSEQTKSRTWRSRHDPFAGVWEEEIVPLLQRDEDRVLQATTVLELLETRHPGRFGAGQLRTLQRRIRDWRALYGSDQEVYFEQVHPPGREAQVDFTHATELGVRVAGELFDHLILELILCFSGWRAVSLAFGETFEAEETRAAICPRVALCMVSASSSHALALVLAARGWRGLGGIIRVAPR